MPRYRPLHASLSQEVDADFQREWQSELDLVESRETFKAAKERRRISLSDIDPYGERSPHSWVLDSAASRTVGGDPRAEERLGRARAAIEKRAVSSTTLGGIIPATIPPYVQECIAYGLRSSAPLALALERLDLPPVGTDVNWAVVSTVATVTNQTAESAALTASADPVVDSTDDPLATIAAYVDFSAQSQQRSGAWFDMVIGQDLGLAFGARLEQQIWNGSGASGQMTGFAVMTGNSSSTVAGQTLANQSAKIAEQFSQVSTNVGSVPDLIALAPRRYAGLQSLTAALALPMENVIPASMRDSVIVSPASPLTLGGGSDDWILVLNKASTPLVRDPEPSTEIQPQGAGGTGLNFKWLIYAYCALGVSRRPAGAGLVKGLSAPSF